LLGRSPTDWEGLAELMREQGWLTADSVRQVALMWTFGQLIANADMHPGNLSFVPTVPMRVAPAYDMLPMMYAPLAGGELPARPYRPALPLPQRRAVWLEACDAALDFWWTAQNDGRISPAFRSICADNHRELSRLKTVA
jgi:HipA-like C-terminal domain